MLMGGYGQGCVLLFPHSVTKVMAVHLPPKNLCQHLRLSLQGDKNVTIKVVEETMGFSLTSTFPVSYPWCFLCVARSSQSVTFQMLLTYNSHQSAQPQSGVMGRGVSRVPYAVDKDLYCSPHPKNQYTIVATLEITTFYVTQVVKVSGVRVR